MYSISSQRNKTRSRVKRNHQTTLLEASHRIKPLDINDDRPQLVHHRVVEMIALDSQPFSKMWVSSDSLRHDIHYQAGIISPLFKVLPKIYEAKVGRVEQLLMFSFSVLLLMCGEQVML